MGHMSLDSGFLGQTLPLLKQEGTGELGWGQPSIEPVTTGAQVRGLRHPVVWPVLEGSSRQEAQCLSPAVPSPADTSALGLACCFLVSAFKLWLGVIPPFYR